MVNAHKKSYARAIVQNNLQRIRAHPTEVRYNPQGIFEFTCISNGRRMTLRADEERPIKYLYENTYGTGLTKNWIAEVQNIGHIEINSTRDADDPLNWYVNEGFIAFFTTNDFRFIYVDDFIHLRCPDGWQFHIVGNSEGLFGGFFELRNDANMIIKVDCGINNGNSGPKIYINNRIRKGVKYYHNQSSFDKLINDLEIMMNL